ncbi:bifunctional 2',3'-cyclic-nucleotide 2'-phosphodiesterase/3'-nucleotidase [Comamonas endophytica]|uniref:Bifunctional 2',3'-cyclic-nucleotide 2'-phosphodiesterase/3'-nucleotidase n=1 Tax=Comamonas endophytica TaxID=2949090 RepID=A0ABY6GGA2_9BURK|nr:MULTISPECIES: bifunctional 2',3'-cyclic-nucleotide 2'-phosphodiesterase/3'-nucleotidase [unclassified Acidovorax]MCD2514287.1 bifunctional 2',3'-cyclic-nucleotide 2'-phosphodiesterase/3'-nucleotidase [Acidovorax sp. D4N7]UYG53537.1 bifunctional 2',3'-cyclic-nucleotide 2'-phosphodiesterase/3'-nucleotidase [Acidovorax sp. 5MLIR]
MSHDVPASRGQHRCLPPLLALPVTLALIACGGSDGNAPAPAPEPAAQNATAQLALLETTDLHYYARSYNYYSDKEDKTVGLERTARLIHKARADFPNNLLVDNGDTVQGTVLGTYEAQVAPLPATQQLSMYKAMATLKYDAGVLGNHEFNFGLPYLSQILGGGLDVEGVDPKIGSKDKGPGFPIVTANVTSLKSGKPLVDPYVILERKLAATQADGKAVTLPIRIGVIGITTPGILNWDKDKLEGKISTQDGRDTAARYVPEVRAKGADLVFVLLHGGMDASGYFANMDNPGYYITKEVPGIDGIVMGHEHNIFPDRGASPAYKFEGADNVRGTVNGVPAVMASSWGKGLGVINYALQWDAAARKWSVDTARTEVQVRMTESKDAAGKSVYVDSDPAVVAAVQELHDKTRSYVASPIGTSDFRLSSMFADVGNVGALQIVNQAQQEYVARYVQASLPQYAGLPVLSVTAPFKTGFSGSGDFTDVAAGTMTVSAAADLYLYDNNTIHAVKVTGAQIKLWLENAANRFNQIDPNKAEDQWLINDSKTGVQPGSSFPGYNFDVFTSRDISYEIDVTQAKYNVNDPSKGGERIKNLRYKGLPMDNAQQFIVATNNYRANSSAPFILGTGKAFDIVWASPDANREVVLNYVKAQKNITRAANGSTSSWRFARVATAGKVLFKSGKNELALARAAGLAHVSLDREDDTGVNGGNGSYSIYRIALDQ